MEELASATSRRSRLEVLDAERVDGHDLDAQVEAPLKRVKQLFRKAEC